MQNWPINELMSGRNHTKLTSQWFDFSLLSCKINPSTRVPKRASNMRWMNEYLSQKPPHLKNNNKINIILNNSIPTGFHSCRKHFSISLVFVVPMEHIVPKQSSMIVNNRRQKGHSIFWNWNVIVGECWVLCKRKSKAFTCWSERKRNQRVEISNMNIATLHP